MTSAQADIRWLFSWAKRLGKQPPNGDQCQAFAERVAIMMADANLNEAAARQAAADGLGLPNLNRDQPPI